MNRVPDTPRQSNVLSPGRAVRRAAALRRHRARPGEGVAAWTHRPRAGAYSAHPGWLSRRHFLTVAVPRLLRHPHTRRVLHTHGVDPDTFRRWVETESRAAGQPSNGRDVRVRADTVARRAGLCERHVQRCRAAARELGVLVDVLPGRRLTMSECAAFRYHDGGHLVGFCTVSAFVVPAWLWSLSPLPQVGAQAAGKVTAVCGQGGPSGPAERGTAAPPALTDRGSSPPHRKQVRKPAQTGADIATLGLARALVGRVGWLGSTSPWRLRQTLRRFAVAGWTAADVVAAMDATQARMSWTTPTRGQVARPWAFLARYLRDLDTQADHPNPELLQLRRSARPWCGVCDPRTRLRGLDTLTRCPACHPLARRRPTS